MNVVLRMIGTLAYAPFKSDLAEKYTSARLIWPGRRLQIDVGNEWTGVSTTYLLLTHTHYDHIDGISTVPKSVVVLVPDESFVEVINKRAPQLKNIRVIGTDKTDLGGGMKVQAFKVKHSTTSLTYALKFFFDGKEVVWLVDHFVVPNFKTLVENVDTLFISAATFNKKLTHKGPDTGQAAITSDLLLINSMARPPKRIFTIHHGHGSFPIPVKIGYLAKTYPKLNINWTKDGQLIKL